MKTTKTKRQIFAWLLLLCMLPLGVTKLTHHHQAEVTDCCSSHAEDTGDKHDADHCLVCQFTLSPYLVFELPDLTLFTAVISSEPAICLSEHILEITHSYLLRGPPTA